jgi:hypothetical protein
LIQQALTTLGRTLHPHISLSKSRMETLCLLIVAMVSARTVNLSHLASERHSTTKIASTYRRLQRFFQHVDRGSDWSARLVVALLGLSAPWHLCLDRTNWKVGCKEVNILMLAIVTRRHRVPLMWTVLDRAGISNTDQRIALMRRYLALFGAASIKLLLADREFIGVCWLRFLNENNVPFVIRVKAGLTIVTEDGRKLTLGSLLRKCRGARQFSACFTGAKSDAPLKLNFAAKRIKGKELLIVASNAPARHALGAYRKRWAIECLFGDAKTRGLNLEDTRLTCPRKLDLLLGIVALAMAWASKTASRLIGRAKMPRKKHGYYAKSWFRVGLDQIRRLLRTDPIAATEPWRKIRPKRTRVV